MKKTMLIAAIAVLPLAGFAAQLVATQDGLQPVAAPAETQSVAFIETLDQAPTSGTCCWVLFMGRYWCVPC